RRIHELRQSHDGSPPGGLFPPQRRIVADVGTSVCPQQRIGCDPGRMAGNISPDTKTFVSMTTRIYFFLALVAAGAGFARDFRVPRTASSISDRATAGSTPMSLLPSSSVSRTNSSHK